jgi:glycosyltransferase involved in cell wall biosynthesis
MDLSVVIPAYNRERTIAATIDSVLACGTEAEIIVVDDGSADRTAEAAGAYGSRVTVIRQANAGPSAARNTGFRRSSGEVMAFLDSDDVWQPGVVRDCLNALRDHPDLDVVYCETIFGNETDGYQPLSPVTGRGRFGELLTRPIGADLYRLDRGEFVRAMIRRNQVFLGSTLIRRGALSAPPFDEALFGGEDYEICLRLAAGKRFAFCSRPLARYEKHAGGLSANPDRMAREFALAVRSLARRPDLLTAEEQVLARRTLGELGFEYGYQAYTRGEIGEARARFAASIRDAGLSRRTAAYWLTCCLPGPLVRLLRRAKRATAGGAA